MQGTALNWKNAQIPENTAFFAIGDIHSYSYILQRLLDEIEKKIRALPENITAYVIFVGDYVDRGHNATKTIDILLEFEQKMAQIPNVVIKLLCGNHDEIVKRIIESTEIIYGENIHKNDYAYLTSYADKKMNLFALESWMFTGGGIDTIKSYHPEISDFIFDFNSKTFNRQNPDFSMDMVNNLMQKFTENIPKNHKDFFVRIYNNSYFILGDYLFTHAGISPDLALIKQGIGESATVLEGLEYINFLMIRDKFLWRDNLANCPYIVVHGHTPSAIQRDGNLIADGQKHYRLCIDTGIYAPNGALTCFMRYGDKAEFMAVNRTNQNNTTSYSIY